MEGRIEWEHVEWEDVLKEESDIIIRGEEGIPHIILYKWLYVHVVTHVQ